MYEKGTWANKLLAAINSKICLARSRLSSWSVLLELSQEINHYYNFYKETILYLWWSSFFKLIRLDMRCIYRIGNSFYIDRYICLKSDRERWDCHYHGDLPFFQLWDQREEDQRSGFGRHWDSPGGWGTLHHMLDQWEGPQAVRTEEMEMEGTIY